ncbi:MAG TPA: cardiolipin synthase [Thermoplasmata archaeon]|nr:cardiolipin synthase [Thermoplasmata archaeon]
MESTASDLLLLTIGLLLTFDAVAILTLIFLERRDPESVIAWLFAVVTLPIAGFVLYLLFGFKYFKTRAFGLKSTGDQAILSRVRKGLETGLPDETEKNLGILAAYQDLVRLLWSDSAAFLTVGNEVEVYTNGHEKFEALFDAIRSAKSHVHLEYYILRNDALGERLLQLLGEKAQQGVEVRLLYDDLGNKVPRERYRALSAQGVRVSGFYRALVPSVGFRLNYRNHRKIAVIDGVVGFIGGFNIGVEYLGQGPLGPWRDSAVRIRGSGVRGLQLRFLLDWNYATKEGLTLGGSYFAPPPKVGSAFIQIVSAGPDTTWNPAREEYVKIVDSARRTCYLQTPYFIPDVSVMTALRIAALSGVDVRIMIPSKIDLPFVHWASLSYVGELLEAGVRVFGYNDGFLHAKTVTIDDAVTSIGTANWDLRSFKWNFETNAVIYDKAFGERYRKIFEADMTRSTEITRASYATRRRAVRFKESISRLFSGAL